MATIVDIITDPKLTAREVAAKFASDKGREVGKTQVGATFRFQLVDGLAWYECRCERGRWYVYRIVQS